MPCVAHHIQLLIKDGFNLNENLKSLIDKISKNIVTKSKCCTAIAEELQAFNKKLCTRNITRWNSTLFMVRSVLKLTPSEMVVIRNKLPKKTAKQKETRNNFFIDDTERKMLEELKQLLEMFEWVTDELQSIKVSISRVYSCINFLRKGLSSVCDYEYTKQIRSDLLKSLNERFGDVNENEVYLYSTFLDPVLGIKAFDSQMKTIVRNKLKTLLQVESIKQKAREILKEKNNNSVEANKLVNKKASDNYIFYEEPEGNYESDDINREIDEYCRTIRATSFKCPLEFWKSNHLKFPLLANLAKKYLGIPASSASVERMFNICGHIFSLRRRKMGIKIFCELVFLKLNEKLL